MPIIKRIPLHGNVGGTINYITQDYKTENGNYVSSLNCGVATAEKEMEMYLRKFHKDNENSTNGKARTGYHIVQSFALEDDVTPEKAHEIGVELMKRLYPNFQSVIATHIDRVHVHNHIVMNSIDMITGKKIDDTLSDKDGSLYRLREESNKIALENNLTPSQEPKITTYKKRNYSYKSPSLINSIKKIIEYLLKTTKSIKEFISGFTSRNFEVRDNKEISVKHKTSKHFTLLDKIDNGVYKKENLEKYFELGAPQYNGEPLIKYFPDSNYFKETDKALSKDIFDLIRFKEKNITQQFLISNIVLKKYFEKIKNNKEIVEENNLNKDAINNVFAALDKEFDGQNNDFFIDENYFNEDTFEISKDNDDFKEEVVPDVLNESDFFNNSSNDNNLKNYIIIVDKNILEKYFIHNSIINNVNSSANTIVYNKNIPFATNKQLFYLILDNDILKEILTENMINYKMLFDNKDRKNKKINDMFVNYYWVEDNLLFNNNEITNMFKDKINNIKFEIKQLEETKNKSTTENSKDTENKLFILHSQLNYLNITQKEIYNLMLHKNLTNENELIELNFETLKKEIGEENKNNSDLKIKLNEFQQKEITQHINNYLKYKDIEKKINNLNNGFNNKNSNINSRRIEDFITLIYKEEFEKYQLAVNVLKKDFNLYLNENNYFKNNSSDVFEIITNSQLKKEFQKNLKELLKISSQANRVSNKEKSIQERNIKRIKLLNEFSFLNSKNIFDDILKESQRINDGETKKYSIYSLEDFKNTNVENFDIDLIKFKNEIYFTIEPNGNNMNKKIHLVPFKNIIFIPNDYKMINEDLKNISNKNDGEELQQNNKLDTITEEKNIFLMEEKVFIDEFENLFDDIDDYLYNDEKIFATDNGLHLKSNQNKNNDESNEEKNKNIKQEYNFENGKEIETKNKIDNFDIRILIEGYNNYLKINYQDYKKNLSNENKNSEENNEEKNIYLNFLSDDTKYEFESGNELIDEVINQELIEQDSKRNKKETKNNFELY